jgi:formyltetrahydrofolate hydrolase
VADHRPTAVLLISCRDQPGIVAAMGDFVYRYGGNIVRAEQHFDREDDVFFHGSSSSSTPSSAPSWRAACRHTSSTGS